jgi:hypothetical protein
MVQALSTAKPLDCESSPGCGYSGKMSLCKMGKYCTKKSQHR